MTVLVYSQEPFRQRRGSRGRFFFLKEKVSWKDRFCSRSGGWLDFPFASSAAAVCVPAAPASVVSCLKYQNERWEPVVVILVSL